MEGNDFILFKHGCGNDSTYIGAYEAGFSDEAKARFDKPCENPIFYHVEVEKPHETETEEHPEHDSNPIIFKIRNASLLDWDLSANGKEEIWFDKAPNTRLESNRKWKGPMFGSVRYTF